jgi:hypothetical protein
LQTIPSDSQIAHKNVEKQEWIGLLGQMSSLDLFLHGANTLYAVSYSVRKILILRIISIVAGLCLVPYFYFQHPEPLYQPLAWNFVFIGINTFHAALLMYEMRPIQFSENEQRIFKLAFRTLTPREFRKLLQLGSFHELQTGEKIVGRHERPESIMFLSEGEAEVALGDSVIATLKPGQFIGEMSYLTGDETSADVIARTSVTYVAWEKQALQSFLEKHPELKSSMQLIIGTDLVKKLRPRESAKG